MEVRGVEVMPHVIEPSYGIDWIVTRSSNTRMTRRWWRARCAGSSTSRQLIAPVQVGVFPLVSRDGLDGAAGEIASLLTAAGIFAEYDESGAIGRKYCWEDEIGTPYAITIDYQTMEDGTATIRERDSMAQVRVKKEGLADIVKSLIAGNISFASLGS